jgi:predicted nucleotidyltransferase
MSAEKPQTHDSNNDKKKRHFDSLADELEDTGLVKEKGDRVKSLEAVANPHARKEQSDAEALEDAKKDEARKEVIEKVVKFTNAARQQYGNVIKSVLIFGSAARGTMVKGSDADLWVVLDDTATKGTADLEKVQAHLFFIAQELKDLHVQTTMLTEFWQWMKMGSPELVNFLRFSLPVYDTGFIKPVKRMLEMGLIPPSEETIKLKANAAQARIAKVELDLKSLVFELRYTALDICQAVVMHYYKQQPDARMMPEFLEKLVKDKMLEQKYVDKFEQLNKLWKDLDHGAVERADCAYLDRAMCLSKEIMERMSKLLPKDVLIETSEKGKESKNDKKENRGGRKSHKKKR